ncbi:DUF3347 domain-containing protein [Flavobacterium sp. GNP001]
MKNTIIAVLLGAIVTVSCNPKNNSATETKESKSEKSAELYACPMHPNVKGENGAECPECGMELTEKVEVKAASDSTVITEDTLEDEVSLRKIKTRGEKQQAFPTDQIVADYLKVKNALTKDDSGNAAALAKSMKANLDKAKSSSTDKKAAAEYAKLVKEMRENASYVGGSSGGLKEQREYFAKLSKNIFDFIKAYGTSQVLYQDYCPMYENGKSGYWISETKDVVNPYFGAEMLNCGRRIGVVQ